MWVGKWNSHVHDDPYHCWWVWLFQKRPLVFEVVHQWRENLDERTNEPALVDPLFQPPAMNFCDKHTYIFCYPLARYPWEPRIDPRVSDHWMKLDTSETFACNKNQQNILEQKILLPNWNSIIIFKKSSSHKSRIPF